MFSQCHRAEFFTKDCVKFTQDHLQTYTHELSTSYLVTLDRNQASWDVISPVTAMVLEAPIQKLA